MRSRINYQLQYNAAKAYKGSELFIFSDKIKMPTMSCLPAIHEALAMAV